MKTEDGMEIHEGDTVFNYYDQQVVIVGRIEEDGWFSTDLPNGGRGPMLNADRVCSIATARQKGWMNA